MKSTGPTDALAAAPASAAPAAVGPAVAPGVHPAAPPVEGAEETDQTIMKDDLGASLEDAPVDGSFGAVELPGDNLLGTVLDGKFRLEKPLGRGGAGRVYLGRQLSLGRVVAVKVMRPELDPEGEQRFGERFFREASLAGALNHPNVVTVHDFGRTKEGLCYIVMELLGGVSLKDLLRLGPIPAERAVVIFEQIVRGLRHAHKAGLVHRDVKPGNVQVLPGDDGRDFVKLLDFGLVKGDDEESGITQHGSFIGTPQYAAPEQVKGEAASARSDLYSTGVMFYRAVTGKLPFAFDNPMAIALAHVKEPYPPMAERAPDVPVPHDIELIVRRCMEKEPVQRYLDADALLNDIIAARRNLFPEMPSVVGTAAMVAAWTGAAGAAGAGNGDAGAASGAAPRSLGPSSGEPRTLPIPMPIPMPANGAAPAVRTGRRLGGLVAVVLGVGLLFGVGCLGGGLWLGPWSVDFLDRGAAGPEAADGAPRPADAADADLINAPPNNAPAEPEAPAMRTVSLTVQSAPAGAEVRLSGALLGTTPLVTDLPIPAQEQGAHRPIELRLSGYEARVVLVDVSGSEALLDTRLSVIARAAEPAVASGGARAAAGGSGHATTSDPEVAPEDQGSKARVGATPAPAPASAGGAVIADGVRFTSAEAAEAVAFANGASKEALLGAGIAPAQANVVLRSRPFADVSAFAATPQIGEKTVAAVLRAVKSP